jgi:hypothetical protein
MPVQDEYVWNQLGRSLGDLGQGLQWLFPGATTMLTGKTPKTNWASTYSSTTQNSRQIPSSLPTGARITSPNTGTRTASQNISTRITSPNTITQAADDTYKQLLSQYGGQAGVSQLAGQTSLPTGFTPEGGKQAASLKDYYAAQQAVGAKNIGDIISSMGYTGPMAEWAKANPMLAQREFAKQRARGVRTSEDVTDQAMQEAAAKGQYFAPPGEPTPDPVTQQRMQQYSTAFQAQKGTEDSSAAQRSQDFINKYKLGSLNIGSYNFPSYDASAMMNAPSQLFK